MSATLNEAVDDLLANAMRVKAERDEAVRLLKESLLYSHIGTEGPFKSRVREFLARLGVIASYTDTMLKRDRAERQGRPDHDMSASHGTPLKEGS